MRLLGYGIILAAIVVLAWPGSRAGKAVVAVTGNIASALRGGV